MYQWTRELGSYGTSTTTTTLLVKSFWQESEKFMDAFRDLCRLVRGYIMIVWKACLYNLYKCKCCKIYLLLYIFIVIHHKDRYWFWTIAVIIYVHIFFKNELSNILKCILIIVHTQYYNAFFLLNKLISQYHLFLFIDHWTY